jgi:hypothetical protein
VRAGEADVPDRWGGNMMVVVRGDGRLHSLFKKTCTLCCFESGFPLHWYS